MRKAGNGGSIINMSSVAGLKGSPTLAAYCATKGAVRLFTKAVALECAHAKDGVRVNSVHPGIIETPIWEGIIAQRARRPTPRPTSTPCRPWPCRSGVKGLPADIANGVLWLASEESRYVTGAGAGDRRRPFRSLAPPTTGHWSHRSAHQVRAMTSMSSGLPRRLIALTMRPSIMKPRLS